MAKSRKSWFERETPEKITLDWTKINCKITERERELLDIINKRKMVRRDMLEIISPSYRHLGNNRTRLMNRSVKKLYSNFCIDKIHEIQEFPKGNTPAILSLDRAGSIILGIPHKRRIKQNTNIKNGKKYVQRRLPSNYRHINGINQLEVDTILFCEENTTEIIQWVHEKPQKLVYGQENVIVIPDIVLELKFNTEQSRAFYAFIEFDTASENRGYKEPPIIRDKVIKYKKYKLSRLWENEYDSFPMLLLVTEEEKRTAFFNKICKDNGMVGLGVYFENYKKLLERLSEMI